MQALRAGWSGEEIERATTHHGERFPLVDFIAESEQCPICGSPMCIRKSRRHLRPVMSCEAGCFIPREVLKECSKDPAHPVAHSEALAHIVRPRQHYAYDLVVQVGLARYLRHKHREEIRAELRKQHRIELSDGTVSILCNRFLSYLEALHCVRSPYLRATMAPYGYPMHLDATNDQGKGGLFVTMDGFRGWVLVSGKIPSEHEDHIRPLIEKTVALFGEPNATMRDLLKAGPKSVASLREQGKPDLICHYHFLRAVGKKLFDKSHAALQAIMKLSGARTRLWELLRELRRYLKSDNYTGRFGAGQVREHLLTLVYWILEGDGKKRAAYPFTLPQLDFYNRCRQAMERSERWVPTPRTLPERRALRHLKSLMSRVERGPRSLEVVGNLEQAWLAFNELRNVLRLADSELPRGGEMSMPQKKLPGAEHERLKSIEEATDEYLRSICRRVGDQCLKKPRTPDAVILKYLKKFGDNLFGHPVVRDEDGSVIFTTDRTNNILEYFFGQQKQGMRRRLGKAHLGRDLEDQPAQVALVPNLLHDDYVRILCGSIDNLPNAFAALDQAALDNAAPLLRTNRNSELKRQVQYLLEQELPRLDVALPPTTVAESHLNPTVV